MDWKDRLTDMLTKIFGYSMTTSQGTETIGGLTGKGGMFGQKELIRPEIQYLPNLTSTPTPTSSSSFGYGTETARVEPRLFDALMMIKNLEDRIKVAELSGQESSYGYAEPHITPASPGVLPEESYGAYHLNLRAGRTSPKTGKPFTQEEAEDVNLMTQYVLNELLRTGGLGNWNPGSYPFYQYELPERAKTKRFIRGE